MKKDSKLYDAGRLVGAESAGYLTNWAARLYARSIDSELKSAGLASAHLPVIFALSGGEALPQKELALRASVEQPTMAATLGRMERDGLIQRTPHPSDRRVTLISLTPAALAKLPAVRAAVSRVNSLSLKGLSEAEQDSYKSLVHRIVDNLQSQ